MEEQKFTTEDGIAELRSEKGQSGTLGGMFYALLGKADPILIEHMEKHFGEAMAHGLNTGVAMAKVEADPKMKREMLNTIARAAEQKAKELEELSKNDG